MKTKIKKIHPKEAIELLSRNKRNRPINKKIVEHYAYQMENDKWTLTGQGISIDEDGNVLDGQHRLSAIVMANKPIEMLVIYDVPKDTFVNYDTGKARSGKDTLAIIGVKNSARVSGGITKYLSLKKGVQKDDKSTRRVNQDYIDAYTENKEVFDEASICASRVRSKRNIYRMSEIIGYIAYYDIILGVKKEKIISFFEESVGMRESKTNIPVLLVDKLINAYLSGRPILGKVRTKLIMYSISKYLSGKNMKILKIQK